jgi:hypothetical protein
MSRFYLSSFTCGLVTLGLLGGIPVAAAYELDTSVEDIPTRLVAQTDWQLLTSDQGRFTVDLPTASPQFTQTTTTVLDSALLWEVVQARTDTGFFAIAYTDLPVVLLAAGQTAVLEDVQSQLLAQDFDWQTLVGPSHEISLGEDLSGREFTTVYQDSFSTLRVYLVKRRLYLVFAIADDIAQSVRFLDSFTVADIWRRYESEPGGFSVSVPLTPIATTAETTVGDTRLVWQKLVARNLYDIEDRFAVAYTDLPPEYSADAFETITAAVVAELDGVVLTQTHHPLPLGPLPSQEFIGVTAIGQPLILRFYQVDNRLYATFARSFSSTRLDRFMNSFMISP